MIELLAQAIDQSFEPGLTAGARWRDRGRFTEVQLNTRRQGKRCQRLEDALLRPDIRLARSEGDRLLSGEPRSGNSDADASLSPPMSARMLCR